jgi:drug/metabolite transporter (DMT)-like permease
MFGMVERVEEEVSPMTALAVAIVAVSTSAILIELSNAPSIIKALYRSLFTTLLLAPLAVTRYRDDLRTFSRRDLAIAVITGCALAGHFIAWFESLDWTSVAASVTLVQSQPLFVAFGAWALLDERVSRKTMAGIFIALLGMVAMSFGDLLTNAAVGNHALYGNALAVIGAIAAAGYVLAGRSLRQRVSLIPYVTVVYGVSTVVLFGAALTSDATVSLAAYGPREWLLFLGMAVGPGIFGHTVINWALKYVESSVVSVSLLGEPIGSTILALAILGQVPGVATIVGGTVVLGGIYVASTGRDGQ